jgi:glutathione S-transferase
VTALICDEIIDVINDMNSSAPRNEDKAVLKTLREAWAAGKLRVFFGFFASKLESSGGPFFCGDNFYLADLTFYSTIKMLRSGIFDHIPVDYDSAWPIFSNFINALESNEVFKPYAI